MRRGFSIVLMLVLGLAPLSPLINGSEDVNLPVCCRRHGAHHCAMNEGALRAMMATDRTPGFAAPQTCPAYPGPASAVVGPSPALAILEQVLTIPATRRLVSSHQSAAPASLLSDAHAVRGPPNNKLS
jgi:hypothetical protein